MSFLEAGYFCVVVHVMRCLLAFRPPCDGSNVCDSELSWLQAS